MSPRFTLVVLLSAALAGAGIAPLVPPGAGQTTTQPPKPAAKPPADDEPDEAETEIVLTDGRRVTGVLIERNDKEVVLRISAIPTRFPADTVAQVRTGLTVLERYHEMRRAIDDGDLEQRLRLAEWLRARRKYRLAFEEADAVLTLDPTNPDARQLHLWLTEQLKLAQHQPPRPTPPPADDPQNPAPPPGPSRPQQTFPLLSPAQINLIRVYETDLNDPPRMLVDRDTITALITEHAGEPTIPDSREGRDALYRKRPSQILDLMFQLKARNLYERVQVQEDPTSMRLFRDRVHSTWLMNQCATSQCHGGPDSGRLWLFNKKPASDATVYTNFLILDRFALTPRPGAEKAPEAQAPLHGLIDYDEPARSPLLQVGLPAKVSLVPHPKVNVGGRQRGFSPVFQSSDDRRFQDAVQWIRSMYRPRPEYPIEYTPPTPPGTPASQEPGKPAGER